MKAKGFRWFLLGYFALLIVAMNIHSDETVGISANWSNGDYSYQAGAPPWSIAFSAVGAGLYVALASSSVPVSSRPMPHLLRRWAAGMIDIVMALVIPAAFLGLIAVFVEYRQTGVFDWVVERQQSRPEDWPLSIVSVLLIMFVLMPVFFAVSWSLGKPTPGSCIFNFRIVADGGSRLSLWRAGLRALLGSMALLAWPCWILAYWLKRDKNAGKFWLDVVFRTHAEFLE
jgi:hypothetical protein